MVAEQPARMPTILACLPDSLFDVACRAIPGLVRIGSLVEARALLRASRVDGLICDPFADGADGVADLFWLAADFPALHVTLYTRLNRARPEALSRLAAAGISDVVLFGYEDSVERWGEMIAHTWVRECVARALRELGPSLERVPQPLRCVLRDAFHTPRRFRTVDQMAAMAGTTRRAVYHRMRQAGIREVREWIDWGRLVNAFALLADSELPTRDAARLVGYDGAHELAARLRAVTGFSLEELQRGVSADAFSARMVMNLLGGAPAGAAAISAAAARAQLRRA